MAEGVLLTTAAKVLATLLSKKTTTYAEGLKRPLTTSLVALSNNVMIFEVVDIVDQSRVKFKAVVEEL